MALFYFKVNLPNGSFIEDNISDCYTGNIYIGKILNYIPICCKIIEMTEDKTEIWTEAVSDDF